MTLLREFRLKIAATGIAACALSASTLLAVPVVFTGSSGSLSASASFDKVGSNLVVTLSNNGGEVVDPAGVLTTVFFNVAGGGGGLAPVSALLNAGSSVVFGAAPAGGNVGGEWSYASGFSYSGANSGISSTGLGIFPGGAGGNFGGPDLDSGANGSVDYGIISTSDDLTNGNDQVTGNRPFIRNSVVFTLSGFGSLSLSSISNVTFQYGTALTEPSVRSPGPSVPETGSTLGLCGIALAGLGLARRFGRKSA